MKKLIYLGCVTALMALAACGGGSSSSPNLPAVANPIIISASPVPSPISSAPVSTTTSSPTMTPAPNATPSIAGSWLGTATDSQTHVQYSFSATLVQNGTAVSGNVSYRSGGYTDNGSVSGSLNGTQLTLVATSSKSSCLDTFTGQVVNMVSSNEISYVSYAGTMTQSPCNGGTFTGPATFQLTYQ